MIHDEHKKSCSKEKNHTNFQSLISISPLPKTDITTTKLKIREVVKTSFHKNSQTEP